MAASKHRTKPVERKGWFQKGDKKKGEINKPIPNYRKTCTSGYLGPRCEAHHIIPQTSLERSILDCGKDVKYISKVQYITDWNINKKENMMGLPHYNAYDLYYQGKSRLTIEGDSDQGRKMVAYFNKFKLKSRKKWLSKIQKVSPESHPIHNPVNWGHTDYDDALVDELKQHVWNTISDKKKEHELDAENVAAALDAVAEMNYDYLKKRGKGVSLEKWERRLDPDDDGWYKPFTMMDVSNPLLG